MSIKVASLYAELKAEVSQFVSGLGEAKGSLGEVASSASQTTKSTDLLSRGIEGIGIVSPKAAAALRWLSSSADFAKTTMAGMGINLSAIGLALAPLAGAFAGVALYIGIAAKAANQYSDEVLDNVNKHTREQIGLAREYKDVVHQLSSDMGTLKSITSQAFGQVATQSLLGWVKVAKELGIDIEKGLNFPVMAVGKNMQKFGQFTKDTTQALKDMQAASQAAVDWNVNAWGSVYSLSQNIFQSQQNIADAEAELARMKREGPKDGDWSGWAEGIANQEKMINSLKDASDRQTNSFIFNMMLQKAAIGGFSEEETAVLGEFAVNAGLMDQASLNASINIYNNFEKITEGFNESATAAKGIGKAINDIPTSKTVTITIIEKQAGKTSNMGKEGSGASGGIFGVGSQILVGDKPGGIPTPYSEIIEGLPGGGFKVYNPSQTRQMRSFAGGGEVTGQQGSYDITQELMDMMQNLPANISDAITTGMQRSAR